MLAVIFGLGTSNVFAVSANKNLSSFNRQTSVAKSYFATKAAAERSVRNANRRGYQARMFYNSSMRKWVVEINYLGTTNNNSRTNNGNTSGNTSGSAIGEGCETALKSAEILYFPSQSMAHDIYKAHLRQGDCAKIWNAGSKGWAVAVKAITGRGLRPNRRSRSGFINPIRNVIITPIAGGAIRPSRTEIAKTGGINSIGSRSEIAGGINSIGSRNKSGGINSIGSRNNSKTGGISSIRAGATRPSKFGASRPSRVSVV